MSNLVKALNVKVWPERARDGEGTGQGGGGDRDLGEGTEPSQDSDLREKPGQESA